MMEVFNGRSGIQTKRPRCKRCTVDTLDSIWFGMKLGVAMIGMLLMLSLWRGIWRNKSAKEQKNK